jgi:23S rRNA pseudouridine1911/1915/1917 synthase
MTPDEIIRLEVEVATPRLDHYLVQHLPDFSRSQIQKLIRQGHVLVKRAAPEAQPIRAKDSVAVGEVIIIHLPPPAEALQPEQIPLEIVFEDDMLVVLNKPAGLVVHPGQGHSSGTLVNALLARYPDLAALQDEAETSTDRPGIVHRLDRDTSGLIVVARTPAALNHLRQQFKARTVEKTYLALVFGQPPVPEGVIDVPLGRDPRHRQKIAPRAEGKAARTHYRLLEDFDPYSLLEIGLETGRTHQIRVHLAWLKCPVVGDTVYGRKKNALGLKRQFLHAWKLRFQHPGQDTFLELEAPLAADLAQVLAKLRI